MQHQDDIKLKLIHGVPLINGPLYKCKFVCAMKYFWQVTDSIKVTALKLEKGSEKNHFQVVGYIISSINKFRF